MAGCHFMGVGGNFYFTWNMGKNIFVQNIHLCTLLNFLKFSFALYRLTNSDVGWVPDFLVLTASATADAFFLVWKMLVQVRRNPAFTLQVSGSVPDFFGNCQCLFFGNAGAAVKNSGIYYLDVGAGTRAVFFRNPAPLHCLQL